MDNPDKDNMNEKLKGLYKHFEEARNLYRESKVDADISHIIVCGMGESGFVGDVLRDYLRDDIPVFVNKSYRIPKFTGKKSLVILISRSGDTEEVINCFMESMKKTSNIIGISGGGKVKTLCDVRKFLHIKVPRNIEESLQLSYAIFPILRVLMNSKVIGDKTLEMDAVIKTLKNPVFENTGKILASKIKDRIPIIYSSERLSSIALGWKMKFNQRSKIHAFYNVFPEIGHSEISAYESPQKVFYSIVFRDTEDDLRLLKGVDIVTPLMNSTGKNTTVIDINKGDLLVKIISSLYLGDWTSYHLALERGVNPASTRLKNDVKRRLERKDL